MLVGDDPERIGAAVREALAPAGERPDVYGDGHAAERIADLRGVGVAASDTILA